MTRDEGRDGDDLRAVLDPLLDGLYRFALAMVGGRRHLAEDITMSAVVAAMPQLRAGHVEDPGVYLRSVVYHEVIALRRRSRVERRHLHHWPATAARDAAPDEAGVDARLMLAPYMVKLPARQRAILLMRFVDDIAVDDIAGALGIKSSTVKTHINRGLARLRILLEEDGEL